MVNRLPRMRNDVLLQLLSRDWLSMGSVQRPLLCDDSVNTPLQQQRLYFLRGRCGGYIAKITPGIQLVGFEFSVGGRSRQLAEEFQRLQTKIRIGV
jgi:hypothetical protein